MAIIAENCERLNAEREGKEYVPSPPPGPLTNSQKNGLAGKAQNEYNTNPIGVKKGRNKLAEGTAVKKELAFNTYLAQVEDPRSFLNLLPEGMKAAVSTIPQELVDQDEDTLLATLKDRFNYVPTAAVEALRNNFWLEHDRVAVTRTEVMNQSNIYLGVVSKAHFHAMLNESPHVLAYVLTRSPEYEQVMRGLLNVSTRRLRDVLNLPLTKADGTIQDPKIIELVLKAAAMVDLRAKGGYIQRSETKNLTLMKQENSYTNVFTAASSTKAPDLSALTSDIDKKIAALEKEMSAVAGVGMLTSDAPNSFDGGRVPEPPKQEAKKEVFDGVTDAEFKEVKEDLV